MRVIKKPETNKQTLSAPVSYAMFVGGILIILYWTLKPFTFRFAGLDFRDLWSGYVVPPSSVLDFVRNLILFMPLGFGLGALLDRRRWQNRLILLTVLLSGFCLTLLVETLQNFLPGRQPSLSDLLANTISALLGLGVYWLWQDRAAVLQLWNESMAVPARVFAILAAYTFMLLLLSLGLVSGFRLQGWDEQYKLVVGNEHIGDRIWRGTVQDLLVLGRSVSDEQADVLLSSPDIALAAHEETALAYYGLHSENDLSDKTGRQPDLFWRTYDTETQSSPSTKFDGRSWLETESAVSEMTRSIAQSSQFTVRLTVKPDSTKQKGPARIVTVSENPFVRNLTLGQEETALILRLRSYVTGENGNSPQIAFPDFFSDGQSTSLLVSFDGLSVTLFDTNSEEAQVLELVPGLAFFALLKPYENGYWQIIPSSAANWALRLFFFVLTLLPVSILISQPAIAKWPRRLQGVLYLISLLLIPFSMELVMAGRAGVSLRPVTIVTAVVVTALLALFLAPWFRRYGTAAQD